MKLPKTIAIFALLIVAIVLVVEFAGPIVKQYTPPVAHAWLSNFGGGLLIAVVITTLVMRFRAGPGARLWTPVRLTALLIGLLVLLVYRPDASCHVKFAGKDSRVICD